MLIHLNSQSSARCSSMSSNITNRHHIISYHQNKIIYAMGAVISSSHGRHTLHSFITYRELKQLSNLDPLLLGGYSSNTPLKCFIPCTCGYMKDTYSPSSSVAPGLRGEGEAAPSGSLKEVYAEEEGGCLLVEG
jgi:hypothetical protein